MSGNPPFGIWPPVVTPVAGVTSFNARTGAVIPQAGDYSGSLITNDSAVAGLDVTAALNTLQLEAAQLSESQVLAANTPAHWWSSDHTVQTGGLVDAITDIGSVPKDFTQSGVARCATAVDGNGQTYVDFTDANASHFYQAGVAADWKFTNDGTACTYAMLFSKPGLATAAEFLLSTGSADTTRIGFDLLWEFTSAADQGVRFEIDAASAGNWVTYVVATMTPAVRTLFLVIVRTYGPVIVKGALNGVTPITVGAQLHVSGLLRSQASRNAAYNNANPSNTLTLGRSPVAAANFASMRLYNVMLDSKVWSDDQIDYMFRFARGRGLAG